MFSGGNRTSQAKWHVEHDRLTLRPYDQRLSEVTKAVCNKLGQGESDACLFETRTAFDCVLRNKVRKGGDIEDNIGKCSFHIAQMKAHVSRSDEHHDILDRELSRLNYMSKSFV